MRKILILLTLPIILVSMASCSAYGFQVSPVIEGMPVPHDGYNVGPQLYLRAGQPAKVTGAVIYHPAIRPPVLIEKNEMITIEK